jgi:putative two-component system response regulator
MSAKSKILIIDDQTAARSGLEALLDGESYELFFAKNGRVGLSMAALIQPDVILLDVMMPELDGFQVCQIIRQTDTLCDIPIILITTLDDRESRIAGLRAGADDFISKPFDSLELLVRLRGIVRLNRFRRIAEQRQELEVLHEELLISYEKTIEGWSNALDLRDKETEGHTLRVTERTLKLARLSGMNDDQLKHVWRGALLHDVGKLGIPDAILLKSDKLTDEEWEVMRRHPVYAHTWLSMIPFLQPALDIPYCHHETWDGTGYPRGIKGVEIPLAARIFSIIDVWDAITSDRPYRKPMPYQEACQYILSQSGKYFDPTVVEIFHKHIDEL